MKRNDCNGFNNIGFDEFDEFSNRSCCNRKKDVYDIAEAIDDISDGIELVCEGLHDIQNCQMRKGIHECREGVCHIEASLHDIAEELHNTCHANTCAARLIHKGIGEIHRGDRLILKGTDDIRHCQEFKGTSEIAEGLCEDEKGLQHIIEGFRHLHIF